MSGVINVNISGHPNSVNIYASPKTSPKVVRKKTPQYYAEHVKGTAEEQKAFKEIHRNWGKEFAKLVANISPERRKKLQERLEYAREVYYQNMFPDPKYRTNFSQEMDNIFKDFFPENAIDMLIKETKGKKYQFNIQPLNKKILQDMVRPNLISNYRPHKGKIATYNRLKDNLILIFSGISDKTYDILYKKANTLVKTSESLKDKEIDSFIALAPKRVFKNTSMPDVITSPWRITQLVNSMPNPYY